MVAEGVSTVKVPTARFENGSYKWQRDALQAFDEGRARFASLMCHRRSRKSTLAINLMVREACRYPKHLYRYIAPTRVEAREIVWDDPWMLDSALPDKKVIPWRRIKGELAIVFGNGSRLNLEGANKITQQHRGKACNGVVFDEWSQHANPEIWMEIFFPMINESEDNWAWFLWTPKGMNHAVKQHREYEKNLKAGTYTDVYPFTLPAYGVGSSGIMSRKALARAKDEQPDTLFRQEYGCEILLASDLILIQPHVVERLKHIHHFWPTERRIISCDPGFGGDECVLMAMVNTELIDILILHPHTTSEIVAALLTLGAKYDIADYIIDNIGEGRGVIDSMQTFPDLEVQDFDARKKATLMIGDALCFNRRAEGWWYTWQEMKAGRVAYPTDEKTREQLCSVCYDIKANGAVGMERKKNVKERLGCSPDRGDAFIAGVWGTQHVEPYEDRPVTTLDDAPEVPDWQAA